MSGIASAFLMCLSLLVFGIHSDWEAAGGFALAAEDGGPVTTLLGTGASFPFPLYDTWFHEYNRIHPDVEINYQPQGSGAGIRQFQQGLVNFAGSDAAMTDTEIAAVKDGVVMLPLTAGSVVLAYNLPGVPGDLRLSRQAYAAIFLGKITRWNDPLIAMANPGKPLPDTAIVVITKSDASGTTFVFTAHLSAISAAWRDGPGVGTSVNFPVGVAGKGTLGVTALIKRTPGAIGYIEYGFAKQTGLPMAALENKSGRFVSADLTSGAAALSSIKLPPNLVAWLPDPPGASSYPIVTYTWILCRRRYADAKVAATIKSVIRYCLTQGQAYSAQLGYIPLPAEVVKAVAKALEQIS